MSNAQKVVLWVILLAVAGGGTYWYFSPRGEEGGACTMEAKQCPDGSYVGRTGPNCEFAACSAGTGTEGWKLFADAASGASFKYPETLSTTYIHTIDWPPKIQIVNGPFTCTEAGSETARAGRTEKRMVDNRSYCVTTIVEGAAGSIYAQYAYAFQAGSKVAIFTFSTRADQCGNYGEPQKTQCEGERETFDLDSVVDRIAGTLIFPGDNPEKGSGVSGMVLLGPICPVVQDPPDPECTDKPYKTSLAITTPDGARVFKITSSDANGKFSITLPPGEYAIRSAAAANILPYCATNDTVRVRANSYATTTVYCDTGIR